MKAISVIGATLLVPFSMTAIAESVASTNRLSTLTVEGNALYGMESSESTEGYSVDSATIGTKAPAALRDIPQSITVLTNDYLEDRDLTHLDDVAKVTPGLRTLSNDSGRSSIYSRGYEYDEYNVDGLPAPMASINGTLPSLSAFDRVEVMRGPSGLFNSTSELGGIINLVRKRATYDTQGSISAGLGSWDRHQLSADVSGALNEDETVRGRVVISEENMPNEIDGNENKDQSIYATVDTDLSESTELSVAILHQKKDISPANGYPTYSDGTLANWDRSTFLGADWNDFNNEMTDVFVDLTHEFDNGGYGRIAARASDRSTDFYYAFTGSALATDGTTSLNSTQRDLEQQTLAIDASYSQPFATFGNMSEFVVGMDYKDYDTDYRSGATRNLVSSINVNSFDSSSVAYTAPTYSSRVQSSEKETGTYAKVTFRPIESLALIGGGRFSWYDLSNDTTTLSTGAVTSSSYDDNGRFTPYGGLVYDLDAHHSFYASYSEVYKPQTDIGEDGKMIDPRVGDQVEVGIKGSYNDGRLNSRFTLFQLTDDNRAASVTGEDYSEATGKTRVTGAELELSGHYEQWEMIAGYTYMDTENLEGDANTLFMLMPKHTINIWGTYTLEGDNLLQGTELGLGMTGMSEFSLTRGSTTITAPSYATVDASISKDITENLNVSLNVNNLFDRKYYSRVGSTTTFNFYGPSRNAMLKATYRF
ncbi:TonB-dependent siderophore receptor [Marinomonas communis]|uniref:TonB-dependent siderophore receptor n=1 Tax=Marinomonas communis TaxID=28254 RepID=UPI001D18A51B|nr:TonB-dependent siderophore receptor [Marinomonas communis]MCC4274002.1 TonB-dependent siderophore receptor [Marinomonas communis]